MPSSSSSMCLSYLTKELVAAAKRHWQFLADLHRRSITLAPRNRQALSIHRYLCYWIPLLRQQQNESSNNIMLVHPLDIAWVGHCDRLQPLEYLKRFDDGNGISDANLQHHMASAFLFQTPSANIHVPTIEVWKSIQADFFYKISSPNYIDEAILSKIINCYQLFLSLPPSHVPLIPMHSIDFVWHTHIALHAPSYVEDCQRLRQDASVLMHHVDERAEQRKDNQQQQQQQQQHSHNHAQQANEMHQQQEHNAWLNTLALWKQVHPSKDFVVDGDCLCHGSSPREYYKQHESWKWSSSSSSSSSSKDASNGNGSSKGNIAMRHKLQE
ncbi:hypothetical protein MPSEU_000058600 [Mayamaea pseudoterrestris]|nr:hypothetical protein MPSEU_000058600 [Mayamaea pseudoterrestris]